MEHEIGLFYWDNSYNATMLLSFAIIIGLFTSLRFFSGIISHLDPSYELAQKDNSAFGISMAGVVFGVTIVLTGVIPNSWTMSLQDSLVAVGAYGLVGILLMALSRVIFDRVALPKISIRDEIVRGNVAAAVVDAGNVIAGALVIRAVMSWTTINTLEGLMDVVLVYAVSQALLTAIAAIHMRIYNSNHKVCMEQQFADGNMAMALRYVGRRIGVAFAITAASHIMVYEIYEVTSLLFAWTMVSVVVVIALTLLSWFASRVILFGIDVNDEVLNQRNVAIGAVQGIIYVSLGILLSALMS